MRYELCILCVDGVSLHITQSSDAKDILAFLVRYDMEGSGLQLFVSHKGKFEVETYENENVYKFLRHAATN